MRLFTESTRVYGNYFVIIEPCTVDTNTIWWNSHNYSKSTFIYKYNCTIKGLEIDVVFEEKHAFSWKVSLLSLNRKPTETEKPLRLSAVRWNAEVFPRQPLKSWNFWPPWPQRQVHLLPRYSHQSPLGLGGLLLCCRVAPIFCEYSSAIFFRAEQVQISGLPIIWRLSC